MHTPLDSHFNVLIFTHFQLGEDPEEYDVPICSNWMKSTYFPPASLRRMRQCEHQLVDALPSRGCEGKT